MSRSNFLLALIFSISGVFFASAMKHQTCWKCSQEGMNSFHHDDIVWGRWKTEIQQATSLDLKYKEEGEKRKDPKRILFYKYKLSDYETGSRIEEKQVQVGTEPDGGAVYNGSSIKVNGFTWSWGTSTPTYRPIYTTTRERVYFHALEVQEGHPCRCTNCYNTRNHPWRTYFIGLLCCPCSSNDVHED